MGSKIKCGKYRKKHDLEGESGESESSEDRIVKCREQKENGRALDPAEDRRHAQAGCQGVVNTPRSPLGKLDNLGRSND